MFNPEQVTGRARSHVVQHAAPRFAAHPATLEAFLRMRSAAQLDGIELHPFSSFRDFDTQLRIWNDKFSGKKTLYDIAGGVRDFAALDEQQLIGAILNWSALPGGSRHHWGSEIDVVDRAVMAEGYRVKLLPEEAAPGGIFGHLHDWLDQNIERFGFFRPYQAEQGGMYPEPWHLSYAPVSLPALANLTPAVLADAIDAAPMLGKQAVLGILPELFERHILNVAAPRSPADPSLPALG